MLALRVESLIAHAVRARWISSLRLQQTQIAGYDRPVKDGSADMEMVLWNALLSFLLAIIGWIMREKSEELHRIQILLNKTREEVAKEYLTRVEVHADITRVLDRLDRLDAKIDRLMESKHAS
jgi:hypothetical protein